MIKKFKKPQNLDEARQQIKDLVPEVVVEKAGNLKNPLAPIRPGEEPVRLQDVPEITSETIAEHREEVLSGARRFIYPLQHSKRRIVAVTLGIMFVAVASLLIYCTAALYKFHQYNTFLYRVTQVVPFPIARADGSFVSYENYLFELRHYVHYYQTQQQSNLSAPDQKQQLVQFRKQALNEVITNAYIKKLAAANKISVSDKQVDARITEVRDQNRLGSNTKVFADVLRDYWGWSINDFKRALKTQILSEEVTAKLDTTATQKANAALAQLKTGGDFATVAKAFSDDPTVGSNGGDYGIPITTTNPNIPPQVIEVLFNQLKVGQFSGVIDAGSTLEIVKLTAVNSGSVTALHISINLAPVTTYTAPLEAKNPPHVYVKF